jgi:hypothetical protein
MLATEHVTSNARDRTALSYLRVGLDDAMKTGKPAEVRWIPTSHQPRELVRLATSMIADRGANVLVLGGESVTFVPLR